MADDDAVPGQHPGRRRNTAAVELSALPGLGIWGFLPGTSSVLAKMRFGTVTTAFIVSKGLLCSMIFK
jgi:hypothetical protein